MSPKTLELISTQSLTEKWTKELEVWRENRRTWAKDHSTVDVKRCTDRIAVYTACLADLQAEITRIKFLNKRKICK